MVINPRSKRILGWINANEPFPNISGYTHTLNAKGFHISRATVHRRMGDLNFLFRFSHKNLPWIKKQRIKRRKLAQIYQRMDTSFWNRVVFSDGCLFIFLMNGEVWRKHGEEYSPKCIRITVKHPTMLMVWRCMSSDRLRQLKFVEEIINSLKY